MAPKVEKKVAQGPTPPVEDKKDEKKADPKGTEAKGDAAVNVGGEAKGDAKLAAAPAAPPPAADKKEEPKDSYTDKPLWHEYLYLQPNIGYCFYNFDNGDGAGHTGLCGGVDAGARFQLGSDSKHVVKVGAYFDKRNHSQDLGADVVSEADSWALGLRGSWGYKVGDRNWFTPGIALGLGFSRWNAEEAPPFDPVTMTLVQKGVRIHGEEGLTPLNGETGVNLKVGANFAFLNESLNFYVGLDANPGVGRKLEVIDGPATDDAFDPFGGQVLVSVDPFRAYEFISQKYRGGKKWGSGDAEPAPRPTPKPATEKKPGGTPPPAGKVEAPPPAAKKEPTADDHLKVITTAETDAEKAATQTRTHLQNLELELKKQGVKVTEPSDAHFYTKDSIEQSKAITKKVKDAAEALSKLEEMAKAGNEDAKKVLPQAKKSYEAAVKHANSVYNNAKKAHDLYAKKGGDTKKLPFDAEKPPAARPTYKPQGNKDKDKAKDKPKDKPADKPKDKPADKPADKPKDKPADKPKDKPKDDDDGIELKKKK